jgi:adenylylsulfate kinase
MQANQNNIHPVFDRILQRKDKESLLQQKSIVIWFTGLSGSGKTTIAIALEKKLNKKGFLTQILDGDNVRTGINNNLGFSEVDRIENIRRIAEVSNLFLNCGIITINCFVSPTIAIREQAKQIINKENFIEVFVNTPLEICEKRDIKGLYKKARAGEIKNFTGIDAPFEAPLNPTVDVKTENLTVEESANQVLSFILPLITSTEL